MILTSYIHQAVSWLLNPKNRGLIGFAVILVLIALLMGTCSRIDALKGEVAKTESEVQRVKNNLAASRDSVTMIVGEQGELIGKISGYEVTVAELHDEYRTLLGKYRVEKGKPPVVITQVVTVIRDTAIYVNVSLEGDTAINVSDTALFGPNDWRILAGRIPYQVDTVLNRISVGGGIFALEQAISLQTVLTREKKTGRIEIEVLTSHPGVTFSHIQGAVVQDDAANAKVLKQARREWSVGASVGYGVMLNMRDLDRVGVAHGPYMGIGIQWSPKWAQWGK